MLKTVISFDYTHHKIQKIVSIMCQILEFAESQELI